jgi:hypothetical protein
MWVAETLDRSLLTLPDVHESPRRGHQFFTHRGCGGRLTPQLTLY